MVINQSHAGTMLLGGKMVSVRISHVCFVETNNCNMLLISANNTALAH